MSPQSGRYSPARSRTLVTAWLGLPLMILAYVWLRYWPANAAAEVAAQLVYLVPPILAAAFSAGAAWLATPRTRAKLMWSLVACATTLAFISETYFSWTHLAHAPVSMRDVVFDAINASAFIFLLAMLCVAAGIDRLGRNRAIRLLLDVVAIVTLGFVLLLRLWMWQFLGGIDQLEALRMAAYALGGALLFLLNAWVFATMPDRLRHRSWSVLLMSGAAVYGIAMMLWPWWSFALTDLSPSVPLEAATSSLFLVGYYFVFLSGLSRVMDADQPWERVVSRTPIEISAWPGVAVSGGVLLAVVALGWASYLSPEQSTEQTIYLGALMVATVCMVGRTALTAVESDIFRGRLTADASTGASNPRGFELRLARDVSLARRFGDRTALLVIDLDDFSHVNSEYGREAGDEALGSVAAALRRACPEPAEVYRLSSDEFAVITPVRDRREGHALAERALAAVRSVSAGTTTLSASVGFAVSPDDALEQATLVRHADISVAWAKRHGKARVAGYDHRVAVALGVVAPEPRATLDEVGRDVARALISATDARDPGNYEHSRNVAALACLLAEDLSLGPSQLERVRLAATLHDVGMIGLPGRSSGWHPSRSPDSFAVRAHCELGARMLHAAHLDDVALWVRHHHERWDGSGYPDGIRGEEIPYEARIIALADTYEKLTSGARLGGPMSKAAALQEIDQAMASRFDPTLAERFIRVIGVTEALGWSDAWPAT